MPYTSSSLKSIRARLDWCSTMLRSTADRGRKQLGDGYPEVLQVLGAVNASVACLPLTLSDIHTPLTKEELDEALKMHHLTHDKPSQLADAFRAGAQWASEHITSRK